MRLRALQPVSCLLLALGATAAPAQTIATGARHALAVAADGSVLACKRPPFRVKTRMAGNLRTLSFHAEVFGSPGPGSGSGTTNLYAFATADLGTWMQLDEQGQWSLLGSPVPPARANVPLAGEARPVVLPILPQLSGVGLAGVRIFVGQGRDAQEMLQAQRFREVLELAPED
jgi:hypothetical protein